MHSRVKQVKLSTRRCLYWWQCFKEDGYYQGRRMSYVMFKGSIVVHRHFLCLIFPVEPSLLADNSSYAALEITQCLSRDTLFCHWILPWGAQSLSLDNSIFEMGHHKSLNFFATKAKSDAAWSTLFIVATSPKAVQQLHSECHILRIAFCRYSLSKQRWGKAFIMGKSFALN